MDFIHSANGKSATRNLGEPTADIATINTIIQSVITNNPFECVIYMTADVASDLVERIKEA